MLYGCHEDKKNSQGIEQITLDLFENCDVRDPEVDLNDDTVGGFILLAVMYGTIPKVIIPPPPLPHPPGKPRTFDSS